MSRAERFDLVILVPGKDERETFDALLSSRWKSLGIRQVHYKILVHPHRDSGCWQGAPEVLEPFVRLADRVLVVFDHEGSGREAEPPDQVAADVRVRLARAGWEQRAEVLVLQPELENWVWSDSPHLDQVAGWSGQNPPLRQWLRDHQLWPVGHPKPPRPKECLEQTLRRVGMPRSSALYRRLAEKVSLERCTDPAFSRFRELMRGWFPARSS